MEAERGWYFDALRSWDTGKAAHADALLEFRFKCF